MSFNGATSENKEESSSAPSRVSSSSGPRPRGSRRQRGKSSRGRGPPRTDLASDRVAQISMEQNRYHEAKSLPPTMNLAKLSEAMDRAMPCEENLVAAFSPVVIDSYGLQQLSIHVYDQIVAQDPRSQDVLSGTEFSLVMGWLFAARIASIQRSVWFNSLSTTHLVELLPASQVPEPLALYFQGLGVHRTSTGLTLFPDCLVPLEADFASEVKGMQPQRLSDSQNALGLQAVEAMFPYGIYARYIIRQAARLPPAFDPRILYSDNAHQMAGNADIPFVNMFRLDYRVGHANDLPNARQGNFCLASRTRVMTATRVQNFVESDFAHQDGLLDRMFFSSHIFNSYLNFVARTRKVISYVAMPSSTSGNGCLAYVSMPSAGGGATPFTAYSHRGNQALDPSERQAVRLFKYRLARVGNAFQLIDGAGGARISANLAPAELQSLGNYSLSDTVSDAVLMNHYVRHFVRADNR